MRQIISTVCVVLWIVIWIFVMGIAIADWDDDGPKMLATCGLAATATTIGLTQELAEWRSHPKGKVSAAPPIQG
jgi:hypothetical protein